ncbi:MAG TPA: UDP-N-acetylmuramate dehydrogenase [Ilumatobacteraceae bacterium]|nr:UDP-N-acetylmuramate dehydrogenase [Ilumatobacteraceae bacterium]
MRDDAEFRDAVAVAVRTLGELAELGVPLGPLTTYRVGGPAAVFVRARSRSDLGAVAAASRASGLPVLAIGRGSNLLVADAGYPGIAVGLVDLPESIAIDVTTSIVTVSAGASLPVVARRTAAAGLTGFEWAVGVPGSIGGAVRMNAGGHGSDMAASLIDVTVIDTKDPGGVETTLTAAELGLAFRHSELPASAIVLDARLQLAPGDQRRSAELIAEIVAWRREHQPGGQNAGSVFVNPVPGEVSAGALVDAAGLRGWRHGSAHVSDKHANFIQADDGGSADDVWAVMRSVRARVREHSGFDLRSEIRLVGFDDGADRSTSGDAGHSGDSRESGG